MIHKLFFIGGLVLLIVAAILHHKGNYAFMYCMHHKMGPIKRSDFIMKRISKKLNLSESQKLKLIEIRNSVMSKHDSLCPEHGKMFESVLSEIEKETLDREKLNNMFQEKIEKVKQMHPVVLCELAELHAMLSPEQKRKLVELMRKHHGNMYHCVNK